MYTIGAAIGCLPWCICHHALLLPHRGQHRAESERLGCTRFLRIDSMTSGGTSVLGLPRSSLPDTLSNLRQMQALLSPAVELAQQSAS